MDKKLCDVPPVQIYPIELLDFIAYWKIYTPKKVSPLLWVGAINKMVKDSMDAGGNIHLCPADIPKKFAYCFSTWLVEGDMGCDFLRYRMDHNEIAAYSKEIAEAVASDSMATLAVLCMATRKDLSPNTVTNKVFGYFRVLFKNKVFPKAPRKAEIAEIVMTVWEACTLATEMNERQRSQV